MIDDDYPEILATIARVLRDFLVDHQVAPDQAQILAMQAAETVRAEIGGTAPYIPKGVIYMATRRDREIYDKFDGTNYVALAREYDLTEMRIRQIVQQLRAADIKTRQKEMF